MTTEHPDNLNRLIRDFQAGKLSRRQFLTAFAALTGGALMASRFAALSGGTLMESRPPAFAKGFTAPAILSPRLQTATPAKLIYGATQDIATLDPSDRNDYSILAISRQVYDRLFRFEGGWPQPVEPCLCETYEASPDSREWTFHITDKAKFHDGTPVTAESVAYSYQRTLRFKKQRSSLLSTLLDEQGVVAKDSKTVVMTLTSPYGSFDRLLAYLEQPIVNMEAAKANDKGGDEGAAYFVDHEAGSGPFTITSWTVGTSYEFAAVPDYWQGWPGSSRLSGFLWQIIRDSGTRKTSLLSGDVDVADTIAASDIKEVSSNASTVATVNYGLLAGYFKMNTQKKGPTSDVNFRKFLAYSFNRQAFSDSQEGNVKLMTGPIPDGVPGYDPNVNPSYTYDPAKAKQYLDMTQYKDGGFSLDFVYVTGLDMEQAAALIWVDEMKKYNITINPVPKTFPDIVGLCTKPDSGPDIGFIFDQFPPLADSWLIEKYSSTSWDRPTGGSFQACSFYKNPDVDKMLDQLRTITDQTQLTALVKQLQSTISNDAPDIPLYVTPNILGFNKKVKGYKYYGDISVDFWRLWIDSSSS